MNRERMMRIIKDIERCFSDLDGENIERIQDLEDKGKFYAASMILFSIINRTIDLGEEVVSDKKLGFPDRYRDIFHLLERNRIINKKLYGELSHLIHFRNLAAHEYQTFTEDDVFRAFKKIKVVEKFIDAVKKTYKMPD